MRQPPNPIPDVRRGGGGVALEVTESSSTGGGRAFLDCLGCPDPIPWPQRYIGSSKKPAITGRLATKSSARWKWQVAACSSAPPIQAGKTPSLATGRHSAGEIKSPFRKPYRASRRGLGRVEMNVPPHPLHLLSRALMVWGPSRHGPEGNCVGCVVLKANPALCG